MATLLEHLEQIERDLARYPGTSPMDILNRRFVLRNAMTAYGMERYSEGHHNGVQDVLDARKRAQPATEATPVTEQREQ